jgi:pimeloyl-ACP methyl ester carboxylesterase
MSSAFATREIATDGKRPLVLLVHGRGYLSRDSATFRREALSALRDGAFRATGDSLYADDDLRIVWYADLMDPRRRGGASGCAAATKKVQADDSPASILQAFAMIASSLLDAAAQDNDTTDVRDLAGDLRFFGDASTRCATETRIGDALARARDEGRPIVLVAHSLGALVTWGHLSHRDASAPGIRRLVTIGSPVGHADLRELLFGRASIALPRGVQSWTNALNPDDPFAARLIATDSTTGRARTLPGITDVIAPRSSKDPHDLRNYLRDSTTAGVVSSAWCEAAADLQNRPAGCAAAAKK